VGVDFDGFGVPGDDERGEFFDGSW